MRLSSVIIGFGAIASAVYAIPNLEERGTYEYDVPKMGYSSDASTATATKTDTPSPCKTHWVTVGGTAGLVYTPEWIEAEIDDAVVFTFGVKNHTLTQSTFAEPCVKMEGGADSEFQPTDGTKKPMYQMTVKTKSPLWFYCKQGNHCKQGMVFAINPAAKGDKTFEKYKMKAMGGVNATATKTATKTATETASVTISYSAPPASPPPANTSSKVPGINVGVDGKCACVCNVDVSNGPPNSLQGVGVFGGSVGNVEIPWAIGAAPAPSPSPSYKSAPSYTTTCSVTGSATTQVGEIKNIGQGTVIAFSDSDAPAPATKDVPATKDAPATATQDADPVPAAAETPAETNGGDPNGFESDGLLGGADGK